MSVTRRVVLGLVAVASTACGGSERGTFERRDSAGVALAVNRLAPELLPEWRLSRDPLLEIGLLEGAEDYQLFRVRGAVRMSDGRIAVLNAGTQEVRFFGDDGQHLTTVGRRGEGPGEFVSPLGLWRLPGDSLLTWDTRTRRLTVLGPDGALARTVPSGSGAANPTVVALFRDGSFGIQDEVFEVPDQGFRDTQLAIARHAADGSLIAQVGVYPLSRIGMLIPELGLIGGPLFEPRSSAAGRPDGFWVGTGREYEVIGYDLSGRPVEVIRWSGPERRVPAEAVDAAHTARLEAASEDQRPRILRIQEAQPVSELFPAYQAVRAGPDGELRVLEYQRPDHEGPSHWLIFDGDGRLRARLVVPSSFLPLEWGADLLLGTMVDELGVERVRLYGLERP
jgi:hypothetical protein